MLWSWASSNFNGDLVVDGQDFIVWNSNKFTSSDGSVGYRQLRSKDQVWRLGERLFANHLQPSNDPRGTVFAAAGVAADPTWPDDLRIAARTTRSSLLVSELVKHRIAREPLKDDIDFALLSLLSL